MDNIRVSPTMSNYRVTCCRDCTKRKIGCHSRCKVYIRQKDVRAEYLKDMADEHITNGYQIDAYTKLGKGKYV